MGGYSPDVIRDFAARFGSEDPIAKAEEKARMVPGFGEEIRRVESEIEWLKGAFLHPPRDELEKLGAERRSLVVDALKEDADAEGGALLPRELVERAVQLHVNEHLGKLKLSQEPGLTEWYAGQILRWHKRGEPEGLWLDDDGRLRWGTAITAVSLDREQPGAESAPTCSHLRLPRI
jgi:hypothetical protein